MELRSGGRRSLASLLRFLLDTNAAIRRLTDPKKLSREQTRVLDDLERRGLPFALSAVSLLEIGVLHADDHKRIKGDAQELLHILGDHPLCRILPLTVEIAAEVAPLGPALGDTADRAIVATARVHRLKLLTADQRIISSDLVTVID